MTSVPAATAGSDNRVSTRPESPRGDDDKKTKTIHIKLDIEHAEVADDPRQWSKSRKVSDIPGYSRPPVLDRNKKSLTFASAVCHRRNDIRSVDDCWSGRQHLQPYAYAKRCIDKLRTYFYTPPAAIAEIESDLHASAGQLSLTLSLFILIQGGFPLIWSSVSEIQGRKVRACLHQASVHVTNLTLLQIVYLISIALCMVGCIVAATAKTINVLIGMRCLQAAG